MPVQKLRRFLEEHEVPYRLIPHPATFTAQETAAAAHVRGREFAKTVMVRIDGELAMAVVPAPEHVSVRKLRDLTGAGSVEVAGEADFRDRFPDIEAGAMPPFGNLWGMRVFVDPRLREDEEIAFDAGSHTELVQLAYQDFERLVNPVVGAISARA